MQFIATTFENSVFGGCSTVATNVGRNGVLLAMQWQKRHPMSVVIGAHNNFLQFGTMGVSFGSSTL